MIRLPDFEIRLPDFEIRLRQKSAIYRIAGLGFHTFEFASPEAPRSTPPHDYPKIVQNVY